MVSPVQATREVTDAWWHPLLLPVLVPLAGLCAYFGKPFTMQRYTYSGANVVTRVVPHLAYDFVNKRHHASINRHLLSCIRQAAREGATVVGLGALNKAHFLNRGGEDLLPHLEDLKGVAVVHEPLTTAVVWDTLRRRLRRWHRGAHGPHRQDRCGAHARQSATAPGAGAASDTGRFEALRESLDALIARRARRSTAGRRPPRAVVSSGRGAGERVLGLGKACSPKDVAHMGTHAHVFEYAVRASTRASSASSETTAPSVPWPSIKRRLT